MNLKLLQELISIPAVAGDETSLEKWLIQFAKTWGIPYTYEPDYGVIFWNPSAPYACMAHIDEVGWKINDINTGRIRFEWVGWVNPSMFVGREVEIITRQYEKIPGLVVGPEPLRVAYESFDDLEIIVSPQDIEKVTPGDTLRYRSTWVDTGDAIFATTLDNRVGMLALISLILSEVSLWNMDFFSDTAFFFATEEELKNKGWLYFVQKYTPKYLIIPDMIPMSFLSEGLGSRTIILQKSLDYTIDDQLQGVIRGLDIDLLISEFDLMKNSEPAKYERVSGTRCVSVSLPTYNYHHGSYFVTKQTLKHFIETVVSIFWKVKQTL